MAASPSQECFPISAQEADRLSSSGWYRALTLTERLAVTRSFESTVEQSGACNAEYAERKLKRWKEQHSFEKAAIFAQRLELDDLSEELMRFLWGESPEALQARLSEPPVWLQKLRQVYAQDASSGYDDVLFMIGGAAGLLTTLLAFYSVAPSPDVLEIAIYCGDHLLRYAAQCGGEPRPAEESKPSIAASHPLTGFSHGAAGMAFSLLQLASVSGEARFQEGAQRALEYERSMFLPEQKNWPDFRADGTITARRKVQPTEGEFCMTIWCHGAPGIGLGRLALLPYQDDPTTREEIAIAMQTTIDYGFGMNHSLCHGDLGNLEIFLTAAQTWGDAVYQDLTQTYATMVLNDIECQGWLTGTPSSVKSPDLMTGISGIGYQLLRLASPERVPNVLILAQPINNDR